MHPATLAGALDAAGSDFARIVTEHSMTSRHHDGVLIALSSRFSRRSAGIGPIVAAVQAIASNQIADRIVHLKRAVGP